MLVIKIQSNQLDEYHDEFMPGLSLTRLWFMALVTYYMNEKNARQAFLKSQQIEHLISE